MKALGDLFVGVSLLILPGAWVAYGLRLRSLSWLAKLALSGALSPAVVCLQFYFLRICGAPYSITVPLIVLLNAGSAWFVIRGPHEGESEFGPLLALAGVYLFLCARLFFPWFSADALRFYQSHTFLQLGILYQFPHGILLPEEPELAGIPLGYPWMGHVFWSVIGSALNQAPTWTYVVTNLLSLGWICILFDQTCRRVGAKTYARLTGLIWMAMGTNCLGALTAALTHHLFSDSRYTPWLRKFLTFELTPFGIALFAAVVVAGLEFDREGTWRAGVLLATALGAMGLIYPPLFPAGLSVVAVLLLKLSWELRSGANVERRRKLAGLLGVSAFGVLATAANVVLLARARSAEMVTFSGPFLMAVKIRIVIFVLLPFLLGLLLVPRQALRKPESLLLLLSALPIILAYDLFHLSSAGNEYKFMFCLPFLLAPVASLALDNWVPRKLSPGFVVIASAVVLFPTLWVKEPMITKVPYSMFPLLDDSRFELRLRPNEPEARWTDIVRATTPLSTVVVVAHSELYLPGITERSEWVAPKSSRLVPGDWIGKRDNLLQIRGYSTKMFDSRKEVLERLVSCHGECNAAEIIGEMKQLKRPLALVLRRDEGEGVVSWLRREKPGSFLGQDAQGTTVWLLEP